MTTLAPLPAQEVPRLPLRHEPVAPETRRPRLDARAAWIWVLSAGLVLYLGIDGGGYDLVVRNQAGVVVWWIVLLGAAFGVLPAARLSRAGWAAVALFGGFLLWSAIASTWSLSSERSLDEVSRVACYFGVLFLALITYPDRRRALRHAVGAVASALVVVIALAVLSRLRPGMFPSAQPPAFLPGTKGRLGWPLDYWNGLAALVALAVPLLLGIATSARRTIIQALAAAAIPMAALCGYLTLSRGGAIAAAFAIAVFIAVAPERIPKLATLALTGAGSAILIAAASHRSAVEQGLTGADARHEGATLLLAVVAVCVLAGVGQSVIGTVARRVRSRGLLTVPKRQARALLAIALAAGLVAFLALHGPARIAHGWQQFKGPNVASLGQSGLARYTTLSGESRYDFWKVGIHAMPGHWLGGWGPGTFQLLWLPRAPFPGYVINAHSLYVETLTDVGLVGLALLVAFFLTVFGAVLHRAVRGGGVEARGYVAAVAGATAAFMVSAAVDWIWQLPVLPVALLLLVAAVLAPARAAAPPGERPAPESAGLGAVIRRRWRRWTLRAGLLALAAGALVAIGVPLTATSDVRRSQADANAGNYAAALAKARSATHVEPGAASADLQVALVLELERRFTPAVNAARAATRDEPANWQTWLVRSRIEAEAGHPLLAVDFYRRARMLNPQSSIFRS